MNTGLVSMAWGRGKGFRESETLLGLPVPKHIAAAGACSALPERAYSLSPGTISP